MITFLCCCGHDETAHKHYSRGSDCVRCTCDRWYWRLAHPVRWARWHSYRRRIDSAYTDLVAMSDELGLYDLDQSALDEALRDARKKLADD